jgi:hypothetical protein
MKKILLSSGCSFTFEDWNWPGHLSKQLNIELLNVGMASQGNALISRKAIYNVERLLENYNNSEILVGIMWSGIDRAEYYSPQDTDVNFWGFGNNKIPKDGRIKNPTNVVENQYNWRIMNYNWENTECVLYYENYHNAVSSMVYTIEHILRVQWYFHKIGIDYFMSTYVDIFKDKTLLNHPEISYLYNQIDFSKFLPVSGCHEWVKENYGNDGGFNAPDANGYIGIHPTSFGHEKFTQEVIMPFIKNML